MTSTIDLGFPHNWRAEILSSRPFILPPRHYTYPAQAEEVERGALEVLISPKNPGAPALAFEAGETTNLNRPFLATCALGFRDPSVPTGLWSTPDPQKICAVSGGYAYIIDTINPERFTMLSYRPVFAVSACIPDNLLLFAGSRNILAWGPDGQSWESEKLSDEGLTITSVANGTLSGTGWQMLTDKEVPFVLDLRTGLQLT